MISVMFLGWTSSYAYNNYTFSVKTRDPAKQILATFEVVHTGMGLLIAHLLVKNISFPRIALTQQLILQL